MTEDEAKTKWCPHARERAAQGMPDGGGNRTPYGDAGDGPAADDYTREQAMLFPCIGSACMAWRWDSEEDLVKVAADTVTSRAAAEKYKWDIVCDVPATGYCGLAGKP